MPLFEFEAGRLVPAQAGHTIDEPVEDAVLDAVADQLPELVGATVLPVSWQRAGGARWLTAMGPDGRTAGLQVVGRLDARTLVDSLARLGRATTTSWADLAAGYLRGADAFRRDWETFRESQPPHQPAGARLHIVAAHVEDDVRPAVLALAGAGVVVHELSARVMSSGRLFLDVTEVSAAAPRLPWLRPGAPRTELPPASAEAAAPHAAPAVTGEGTRADVEDATPPAAVPAAGLGPLDDRPADGLPSGGLPGGDLRAIGQSLAAAVPLVWADDGVRHEARLTPEGWIELADDRVFGDPAAAAAALGAQAGTDAWSGWRFGELGPSLHEARTELRAHRARRPRPTAQPGLRRRARRRREAIE